MTSVLVLAGTAEAADLARRLHAEPGVSPTASFAGRVRHPAPLPCPVRIGGFGGVDGLVAELQRAGHHLLIDATHPFAARMSAGAAIACRRTGTPRLRLLRPGWQPVDGDRWHRVADLEQAAVTLAELGVACAFLATGRHQVEPFARLGGTRFVLRSIEPPGPLPLAEVEVVLDRGPFDVDAEVSLLERYAVGAVVTRDSGGDGAAAKLVAARRLAIPVVMVDRPAPPPSETVPTVDDAVAWVLRPASVGDARA